MLHLPKPPSQFKNLFWDFRVASVVIHLLLYLLAGHALCISPALTSNQQRLYTPGYITERRTQRMAEPKCPECSTGGKRHIVAEESDLESKDGDPWFEIVYCDQCGHVYGVFPKLVLARNVPSIPKI